MTIAINNAHKEMMEIEASLINNKNIKGYLLLIVENDEMESIYMGSAGLSQTEMLKCLSIGAYQALEEEKQPVCEGTIKMIVPFL